MSILLGENNYGKQRIRLLRVSRLGGSHDIQELTIGIRFEGDFQSAHTHGDNKKILPTDTMKNTVYALARRHPIDAIETFCAQLVDHFLSNNPQATSVSVMATETLWARFPFSGKPYAQTFTRSSDERRTAQVDGSRSAKSVKAGIEGLVVLKTTNSAFEDFLRDEFTTLKETRDRILSTVIQANWTYRGADLNYETLWQGVRKLMLETFAAHDSKSVQQTLYAMGEAVLNNFENIREIQLSLPNKHYLPVDLSPFEMNNPGEIFLPTDEPHGLIEATLRRD